LSVHWQDKCIRVAENAEQQNVWNVIKEVSIIMDFGLNGIQTGDLLVLLVRK
jgi:hypothetical protein